MRPWSLLIFNWIFDNRSNCKLAFLLGYILIFYIITNCCWEGRIALFLSSSIIWGYISIRENVDVGTSASWSLLTNSILQINLCICGINNSFNLDGSNFADVTLCKRELKETTNSINFIYQYITITVSVILLKQLWSVIYTVPSDLFALQMTTCSSRIWTADHSALRVSPFWMSVSSMTQMNCVGFNIQYSFLGLTDLGFTDFGSTGQHLEQLTNLKVIKTRASVSITARLHVIIL